MTDDDKCDICKMPFDDALHENCGGTCRLCMATVGEDPDCMPVVIQLLLERVQELEKEFTELHFDNLADAFSEPIPLTFDIECEQEPTPLEIETAFAEKAHKETPDEP